MSFTETVLLGALAGFTIYLGLPFARLRLLGPRARVALAMFAVGVLAFLFVDVMEHGFEIVEDAVTGSRTAARASGTCSGWPCCSAAASRSGSAGLASSSAGCAAARAAAADRRRRGRAHRGRRRRAREQASARAPRPCGPA